MKNGWSLDYKIKEYISNSLDCKKISLNEIIREIKLFHFRNCVYTKPCWLEKKAEFEQTEQFKEYLMNI